jgi:GNAT superfamily N-acetyltransferase
MKQKALEYLNKNSIKHIGLIECVKYDEIEYIYCEDDGVFIFDKTAKIHMIATDSAHIANKALGLCSKTDLMVCHNGYEYDIASNKYQLFGLNKCYQVVWTQKERPVLKGVCDIKRLEPTEDNIDFVYNNYTLKFTRSHIEYILSSVGLYGAYVDGQLVGFIGRHEERSLGLLEVVPEYRRRGIATELENYMINKLLDNGEVPYGHIIYSNEKSIAMHKKYGFTFSDTPVYWIFK